MSGDLLDLVLVVAMVVFALSGYREGFVTGVLSLLGFVGGGAIGAHYSATIGHLVGLKHPSPVTALIIVFVIASIGQLAATILGSFVRKHLVWKPLRQVDAVAGAGVRVLSLLVVAWLLGQAVAHSALVGAARQVRHSVVLRAVDQVMPDVLRRSTAQLRRLMAANGLPPIFDTLGPERVVPIDPPDPRVTNSAAVRADRPDIVKVKGIASSCQKQNEGSGFVYARERVMTNAHVVAGVGQPTVQANGTVYDATVVLFDYKRDVAVLYVPGLRNAPLHFGGVAPVGGSAIVAGFPLDGPFDAQAARIRNREPVHGPDIYQSSQVVRDVYVLRAKVREGNSGGPLLAPDGGVYGVVFAKSADDAETGYALTAAEVAGDARDGETATGRVSTRGCD